MFAGTAARLGWACVAAFVFLVPPAAAADGGLRPPPIPHGRELAALVSEPYVLLALRPGLAAERIVAGQGGALVSGRLDIWRVGGPASARLIPELGRLGLLRYAEPNRIRSLAGYADLGDPLVGRAWHLDRIGAATVEPPAAGIVPITIVDTGLDVAHPDFAGRPGVTLLNAQAPSTFGRPTYHGTMVASTAGAAANGVGTVGVYPTSTLRIYDLPGLDDATIIAALDRVASGGVVNLSLGGPGFSRALYEAVMRAVDHGALVVAAAGNSFHLGNPDIYPADYPHVLTVAATDQADMPAFFSSGSEAIDVAAPGTDIPVQDPGDPESFDLVAGTSFSAPIVSAVAAWVWSARPDLEAAQVSHLLRRTARDAGSHGFDERTGFGVVSLHEALAAPASAPDPAEPNDDVDLVANGRVLGRVDPPLTGPGRTTATLVARLDAVEDPHDVYRVFVPAGRTAEIMVAPDGPVDAALWSQRTRTIAGSSKNRLALGTRPRAQVESLRWQNTSSRGVTVFVDLWIPRGRGGDSADYTLRVRTR
jgi:Subtilase family